MPRHIIGDDEERAELMRRSRAYTHPYAEVVRAKIVLLADRGLTNQEIGARLDANAADVHRWRVRFAEHRLAGLDDVGRRGRPPTAPAPGADGAAGYRDLAALRDTLAGDIARGALLRQIDDHPRHGYELARVVHQMPLAPAGNPKVYRLLRDLEAGGLVSSHWQPGAGGASRRIYQLTTAGHAELDVLARRLGALADHLASILGTAIGRSGGMVLGEGGPESR